ncbi:MAG: hypothetical protein M3457_19600 [Chloroflexota bacterium]|nr:hypothetical protein [Chloroflexota bacterium]
MATDPTQSIRYTTETTPLATNVHAALQRLAAIPPSTASPILTVTVDWRPEGTHPGATLPPDNEPDRKRSQRRNAPSPNTEGVRRPGRIVLDQELKRLVDEHGPRGEVFDSLTQDSERIAGYLDAELDPSVHGVAIVSCSARDIFEAVPLALPLPTTVSLGSIVALSELARIEDDYPTYAVLLTDQQDAMLSFVTHATAHQRIEVEGTDYPRKQAQGGWSQRRFQQRADERVEAFARDVAEETRKALDELDVWMLIVAGDEVITPVLDASFHQTVKDRVIATLRLDIRTSESDLLEATLPVAEAAARDREAAIVQRLQDAIGHGEFGAKGAKEVVSALQAGQVDTLVMVDDFEAIGWADFGFPAYGTGDPPKTHPLGGDRADIVPVDLREALVYLAQTTDAAFNIIHSAAPVADGEMIGDADGGNAESRLPAANAMDEIGGVGAILRYAIDHTESG